MISHAEAIDRIGDAATERHGIERLVDDSSSDPELRAHIATCDACRHEIRAWQTTAAALMLAAPATEEQSSLEVASITVADEQEPVPPLPADARERVLASVISRGIPRGSDEATSDAPAPLAAHTTVDGHAGTPASVPIAPPVPFVPAPGSDAHASRKPVRFRWLALAAAAVLVVFVAGALLGEPLGLVHGNTNTDQLRTALAASGRILEQPGHRQAALVDKDGTAVGSVLIDGQNGDMVVLSTGGDDPGSATAEYHCYLIRGDSPRTWLGEMIAQAGTSFWAGHVHDVTDLGRPGDVIQVVDDGRSPEFTATF